MPSQEQNNQQQIIVYALVAIAVLLIIIVGVMVYNNMNSVPAPTASSTAAPDAAAQSIAGQMPSPAAPVEFDTKTATKLPAGMTPETALKTYMEDVLSKKWKEAYALLPLAQRNSYGSADAYGQQVAAYGISGYELGKPQSAGTDVTIVSTQKTAQMNISYTWTFTQKDGTWYAKSRAMGGSTQ
jgi:hypothetical protein